MSAGLKCPARSWLQALISPAANKGTSASQSDSQSRLEGQPNRSYLDTNLSGPVVLPLGKPSKSGHQPPSTYRSGPHRGSDIGLLGPTSESPSWQMWDSHSAVKDERLLQGTLGVAQRARGLQGVAWILFISTVYPQSTHKWFSWLQLLCALAS